MSEQPKFPNIWIKQMMALPVICEKIYRKVLKALYMTYSKCDDCCETSVQDPECECLTCNQALYTVLDALPVSNPKCLDDCRTYTTDVPNVNGKVQLNFIEHEPCQNITNIMDTECECLTCNQASYTVLDASPVSDPLFQDDCKICTTDVPNFNGKTQLNFIDDEASKNITNFMDSIIDLSGVKKSLEWVTLLINMHFVSKGYCVLCERAHSAWVHGGLWLRVGGWDVLGSPVLSAKWLQLVHMRRFSKGEWRATRSRVECAGLDLRLSGLSCLGRRRDWPRFSRQWGVCGSQILSLSERAGVHPCRLAALPPLRRQAQWQRQGSPSVGTRGQHGRPPLRPERPTMALRKRRS